MKNIGTHDTYAEVTAAYYDDQGIAGARHAMRLLDRRRLRGEVP